jgi:hypothetical protein
MYLFAPLCLLIQFLTNDGDDAIGDDDANAHVPARLCQRQPIPEQESESRLPLLAVRTIRLRTSMRKTRLV